MNEAQIEKLVSRLNTLLSEKSDPMAMHLTPRAAAKLLSILAEEGKVGFGLRFGDKPAGCNGYEHFLDYSEKAEANDEIFESQGIQIHVDKSSTKRLLGSEIDYVEGLKGAGFKISNPNAKSSCGCGTSHDY